MTDHRYEISITFGPCSESDAEFLLDEVVDLVAEQHTVDLGAACGMRRIETNINRELSSQEANL